MSFESLTSSGVVVPLVLAAIGALGFVLAQSKSGKRKPIPYLSTAIALGTLLLLAAIYDVVRGIPFAPVAVSVLGFGMLLAAGAYRPRFFVLAMAAWIGSGVGLLWTRPDWFHYTHPVVASVSGPAMPGIHVDAYASAKRKYAGSFPLISFSDATQSRTVRLVLRFPGARETLRVVASNPRLAVDGGAALETTFDDPYRNGETLGARISLESRSSDGRYVETPQGLRRIPFSQRVEIPVAVPPGARHTELSLDVRMEGAGGTRTERIVVVLERRHEVRLGMQAARL